MKLSLTSETGKELGDFLRANNGAEPIEMSFSCGGTEFKASIIVICHESSRMLGGSRMHWGQSSLTEFDLSIMEAIKIDQSKETMAELMTLKEAIFTIPNKTKFTSADEFKQAAAYWEYDGQVCHKKEGSTKGHFFWFFEDGANFGDDEFLIGWLGEIEPKVLTAEEIADSEFDFGSFNSFSLRRAEVINLIRLGDKNGHLRYKELREAIEGLDGSKNHSDVMYDVSKIHQALKNIKPLNP